MGEEEVQGLTGRREEPHKKTNEKAASRRWETHKRVMSRKPSEKNFPRRKILVPTSLILIPSRWKFYEVLIPC